MLLPTPIQEIVDPIIQTANVKLFLKREDLNHPTIQGNKYRKLKYNVEYALKNSFNTLLTFGGAFSNHIYATAAAGKEYGLKTIGVIRGEQPKKLNPTLKFALECGMKLKYIPRSIYREKYSNSFLEDLKKEFGLYYLLPEGGTNQLAIKGCQEIYSELKTQGYEPDYLCSSVGTGGTLVGLISGANHNHQIIGFSSLKGDFLTKEIQNLLKRNNLNQFTNWNINTDYHFGGYAKHADDLILFINSFYKNHKIKLDPIYTGKMLYGIFDLIQHGFFKKGTEIMAIHTGGLQGIEGFNQRYGNVIFYE